MQKSWMIVVPLLLAACGDEDEVPVAINFAGVVGAEPFECGRSYDNVGSTNATITPRDFRFYLSEIALVVEGGELRPITLDESEYHHQGVALIDFEDASGECSDGDATMHTTINGTALPGEYKSIQFTLGLPVELNHAQLDSQPSPLNKSALYWDWMGGHLFLVATSRAGTNDHFTHLGSTQCEGDPENGVAVTSCARPNRRSYTLEGFDPAVNTIAVDFKAIKAGVDVTASGGCHSFSEAPCTDMFKNLGIDWGSGQAMATQSVFNVR